MVQTTMTFSMPNPAQTAEFAHAFAQALTQGQDTAQTIRVALNGDVGAGKSEFAQALEQSFGQILSVESNELLRRTLTEKGGLIRRWDEKDIAAWEPRLNWRNVDTVMESLGQERETGGIDLIEHAEVEKEGQPFDYILDFHIEGESDTSPRTVKLTCEDTLTKTPGFKNFLREYEQSLEM